MPRAFIEVLPPKKLFPPRVREARFLLPWARGAKSFFRGKTSMNEPGINPPPPPPPEGCFFLRIIPGGSFLPRPRRFRLRPFCFSELQVGFLARNWKATEL